MIRKGDVIVQLTGGLGNQMFQYAAARALAVQSNSSVWLDGRALSLLARQRRVTARSLEVDSLNIRAHVATEAMLKEWGIDWRVLPPLTGAMPPRIWNGVQKIGRTIGTSRADVLIERSLTYDDRWPFAGATGKVRYLMGYWQSSEYFSQLRPQLTTELSPREPLSGELADLDAQVRSTLSLVLHVRRGDLATNLSARAFHGLLGHEYYEAAYMSLASTIPFDRVYVFSDDIDWCRIHLRLGDSVTWVDPRLLGGCSAQHLHVMTGASAIVVANSSFSWWAAWLSGLPGERIIAPKQWVRDGAAWSGPVPADWRRQIT